MVKNICESKLSITYINTTCHETVLPRKNETKKNFIPTRKLATNFRKIEVVSIIFIILTMQNRRGPQINFLWMQRLSQLTFSEPFQFHLGALGYKPSRWEIEGPCREDVLNPDSIISHRKAHQRSHHFRALLANPPTHQSWRCLEGQSA